MEFSPADLRQCGLTSRDLALRLADLGYEIRPLTQTGNSTPPLDPSTLPATFHAPNVLCTPKANDP